MKTNFYYLLPAALLALAACSSETDFTQEDVQQAQAQQDVPVAFSTYMGTAGGTRATNPSSGGFDIDTDGKLQSSGFGVFAYLTGASAYAGSTAPNFMYNQQVTYSGGWTYTPVKYWPNGIDAANADNSPSNTATQSGIQYLSFFAYAPYVANVPASPAPDDGIMGLPDNSTATRPVITYKLPSTPTASNTVDLLWGIRGQLTYNEADGGNNTVAALSNETYNENLTKQTTTERVKFLFKHALAKIGGKDGLKVVADFDGNGAGTGGFGSKDANTLITVKSVTIKDALSSGTTTMIPSGEFDISTGTWSGWGTSAATAQQTLASIAAANINEDVAENFETNFPTANATNNVVSNWNRATSTTIPGVTTTAQDVYKSDATDGGFLLIPGQAGQTLEVEVEYVVRTFDSSLNADVASGDGTASSGEGTWTKVTQKIKNNVTLPALEVNKYYTLVIHLGLTSVKFSAEVSDWDAAGDADTRVVWLPSNVVDTTPTTSVSIEAGTNQTVYAAATTDTFTINVTGCNNGETVTVTRTGVATAASATEPSSNTAAVSVTLPANASTTETASSTITITGTKSDGTTAFTTTVTIIQAKASS